MIDVSAVSVSNLWLKRFARFARWMLWLLFFGWVTALLVWATLSWVIVPRIAEFRPQLEQQASQVLGVPVRIGAIAAHSSGMLPSFELHQVQLFDAQGREALKLPKVVAALSPRSIWNLGFEQLYIDGATLSIRRAKDGKIYVAGLDFSQKTDASPDVADWFFSQSEFVVRSGNLVWEDELRGAPPLALQHVEVTVRNTVRSHHVRIDATPAPQWGTRFSLRGVFHQPLWSRHRGQWQEWDGQLYGAFGMVDVSQLRRYADLGVDVHQGKGAVRAWADVRHGQLGKVVADLALAQVNVTLAQELQPLVLQSVKGRLAGRVDEQGYEVSTQQLLFTTQDGLRWPGGNVSLNYQRGTRQAEGQGSLVADKLDLAALTQIAHHLPIDARARNALQKYAPKGQVERIQASWSGPVNAPNAYQVRGLVSGLALAAQPAPTMRDAAVFAPGIPGLQAARIDFDFNESSGKADVSIANGAVDLPGILEEARVPVNRLVTSANWQVKGEHIAVQLPRVDFSNPDAQGSAQVKWETATASEGKSQARFPGVLDLQATLKNGEGTRVFRYLPTIIDTEVRAYVRDAVGGGLANGIQFKVKGDLSKMPFADARQGEFKISAQVQNARFAYVPRSLQSAQELPWPALTQLSGELVIDRTQLRVRGAHARVEGAPNVQITNVEALIPDVEKGTTVNLNADAQGPLPEVLGIVNRSPLGELTGFALKKAAVTGNAQYKLKLTVPIATVDRTTVQGSVKLAGNEVQISPDTPKFSQARGQVAFSERGVNLSGVQARLLGGDARLDGGLLINPNPGGVSSKVGAPRSTTPTVIRIRGVASADGLRQAKELGVLAPLAQNASGNAAYSAVLGLRRGEPEIVVTSNLLGMALALPAPLNKSAETSLPLRFESSLVKETTQSAATGPARLRDQILLDLGRVANVAYVRDISGSQARVLRGSIAVGLPAGEVAPMPADGVSATINVNQLDLDALNRWLTQTTGSSTGGAGQGYLPTRLNVRAQELAFGGYRVHDLNLTTAREGNLWRSTVSAAELMGAVDYRQPGAGGVDGRIFARLTRLSIAQSAAGEVETMLAEQPASIPALDVVVDDFELRGKHLGRLELGAQNRGSGAAREWRLNKLNVTSPEAVFSATGNWTTVNAQTGPVAPLVSKSQPDRRRTVMNFKLVLTDAGELLTRLGMKDVVKRGRGKLEGHVGWLGSPITPDYASMAGAFAINVENGQFLKADPGAAKLLGVLSLQSLPRRLTLDFKDVFDEGLAFDFLRGDVAIEQGVAKTNNLQMKGVSVAVLMDGQADIARETQDIRAVVVPEVNAGTASLITAVINPAVGLSTFLAQWLLRRPLMAAATQEFHLDGSWSNPRITKVEHKSPADAASAPKTDPANTNSKEATP